MVNGLTAGLVAATQADIPLTHRDHTQGVTFITGHRRDGSQPNWPALVAGGTTLVVYMGMQNINVLCQEWRQAGMPETMPAAVIQHASTPQQRILISELSRLAADVEAGGYGSPAIIVLGEVVKEKHGVILCHTLFQRHNSICLAHEIRGCYRPCLETCLDCCQPTLVIS